MDMLMGDKVSMGTGYINLKLITDDAIYRDDDGTEDVVAWPTQQDVDLARRITEIAANHGLAADPSSVSQFELGLDTPGGSLDLESTVGHRTSVKTILRRRPCC